MGINKIADLIHTDLVKSTSIYLIAKLIKSLIPFFMLPIMTAYLTKADYGTITMLTTVFAFVMPFVTLELNSAIQRRYYYKNENIASYIGNCILISFLALIVTSVIIIFLSSFLSSQTNVSKLFLVLTPLYCYTCLFENIIMTYWQVNEKPIKYGVISIAHTVVELSLAILLIVCLHFDWQGRAISIMVSSVVFAFISIALLSKEGLVQFRINKEQAIHAFKYGIGLIPHCIGASLIGLSNRFFLTSMISVEETGLFGVASQFAGIMSFFTVSLNNAFVPWLYRKLSADSLQEKQKVVRFTYLYSVLLPLLGILLYMVIVFIFPFFVNSNFYEALAYVPWLIVGAVFNGFYYMFTNYILYIEKTYYLAIITIIVGLISLLINYTFIKAFGSIGVSIANAAIYFVYFVLVAICACSLYKMPWFNIRKSNNLK